MHIDPTMFYCVMFLTLAFFVVVFKRHVLFADERSMFANEMQNFGYDVRARVAAAIQRREAQQRFDDRIVWGLAVVLAVASVLGLTKRLDVAFVATLGLSALSIAMMLHFLRTTRNVSGVRVASLSPRTTVSLVPLWYMALPVPVWIVGVVVGVRMHEFGVSLLAVAAALVLYGACFEAARAPAIIDPNHATDEILDRKVRTSRVRSIMYLSAMLPTVTVMAASLAQPVDAETSMLRLLMVLSYTGMMFWSRNSLRFTPQEILMIVDDNGAAA